MESALFDKAIEDQLANLDNDPARAQMLAYIEVAESKSYRGLQRHQSQLRRSYEKAWKELEAIQAQRNNEEKEVEEAELQNEPKRPYVNSPWEDEMDRKMHQYAANPTGQQPAA
jgi:hypothetical protein